MSGGIGACRYRYSRLHPHRLLPLQMAIHPLSQPLLSVLFGDAAAVFRTEPLSMYTSIYSAYLSIDHRPLHSSALPCSLAILLDASIEPVDSCQCNANS